MPIRPRARSAQRRRSQPAFILIMIMKLVSVPIRNCLFLLRNAKTNRISLASELIDIHTQQFELFAADSKITVEASLNRPIGINGARDIQQQHWSRVTSENDAGIELMLEAYRLVQLQMLDTSIVSIHKI
jgi:hypothetical protein